MPRRQPFQRRGEQLVSLLSTSDSGRNMEARAEHQTKRQYSALYGTALTCGAALVALVVFWCVYYRGGFAWPGSDDVNINSPARSLQFNWHPVLMVSSLVFVGANAILIFRTKQSTDKYRVKLLHGGMNLLAFIFAVVGLQAVFEFHNYTGKPNLYTLHSWFGLCAITLFAVQLLGGCVVFLYPGLAHEMRAAVLPVHAAMGAAIFLLTIVSASTGFAEKAIFALGITYAELPGEGVLINIMGMLLVLFGGLVLYLVGNTAYKRVSNADDQVDLNIE